MLYYILTFYYNIIYYTVVYYIKFSYISSARRTIPGQSHFWKANSITALEETGIRSRMKPKDLSAE